eukprot:gene9834-13228_t
MEKFNLRGSDSKKVQLKTQLTSVTEGNLNIVDNSQLNIDLTDCDKKDPPKLYSTPKPTTSTTTRPTRTVSPTYTAKPTAKPTAASCSSSLPTTTASPTAAKSPSYGAGDNKNKGDDDKDDKNKKGNKGDDDKDGKGCNKSPRPTSSPTQTISFKPSLLPTNVPSALPTTTTTNLASNQPTLIPTNAPSALPTATTTNVATDQPTLIPTNAPSALPTATTTNLATDQPTIALTSIPSTVSPTSEQTIIPTYAPTADPTIAPTVATYWLLGASGYNCTAVCSSIGSTCSETSFNYLSDKTSFENILNTAKSSTSCTATGTSYCNSYYSVTDSSYHYTPWTITYALSKTKTAVSCYYSDSTAVSSSSSCDKTPPYNVQRFCPCLSDCSV